MNQVRPEISYKNKYYIPKHRYYELKHFCMQYPIWQSAYYSLDGLSKRIIDGSGIRGTGFSDPTGRTAVARDFYQTRMKMVERAAAQVEDGDYILKAVIYGLSYTYLSMNTNISISRDVYYEEYRKFFWILNKIRE
mgnify:CR=1 FL=1